MKTARSRKPGIQGGFKRAYMYYVSIMRHFSTRLAGKDKTLKAFIKGGGRGILPIWLSLLVAVTWLPLPTSGDAGGREALLSRLEKRTRVFEVKPSAKGGHGVRMVYYAPVKRDTLWRFKTDFQNEWLISNKYIESNRFIGRRGNEVLIATRYTYGPKVDFRWKTYLYSESRTMRYILLNPEECGQKFNEGWIKLEAVGDLTRVTQTSYFDFTGAFFWAKLPGPWGMAGFLRYTAKWEQATILRLKKVYAK
jgi:hypothetical protein